MTPPRSLPWLLALTLSALAACYVCGQEPEALPVIPTDGTDVFCWVLKNHGFGAVPSIDNLQKLPPEQTLIVVFGRTDVLDRLRPVVGDLRKYQERGGAVLFASDYPGSLPEWGLTIPADTVAAGRSAYRDNHDCPLITKLERFAPPGFHELPRGLATNRPSYFHVERWITSRLGLVARFNDSPVPYILCAGAGDEARGRALLIAGHGLFTNAMLLQTDNDNFRFADDCVRWLREGPERRPRRHALFLVDGDVVKSFDTSLKPPTLPTPPIPTPTIQIVNHLLAGMEREGTLFRVLRETLDVRRAVRFGLILLTVALLCYGAKKVVEQRHHAEAGALLVTGPHAAAPDRLPLVQQRFQSQVARDALWEEARALVRAWFHQMGGVAPADWDRPAPEPYAIETAGGWWQQRRLRRQVEQLGQFAGHRLPTAYSWVELVRLTKTLEALTAAVREGRLRLSGIPDVRRR